MNFQPILDAIVEEVAPLTDEGAVATYIPALARVSPNQFGIAVRTNDGRPSVAARVSNHA